MSAWGAASTLGGATGVLVGGLLAGSFGWSSVFLVTVPVSVAAVVLARRCSTKVPAGATPVRRQRCGRHHRGRHRAGPWRPRRGRPRMDLLDGHREFRRQPRPARRRLRGRRTPHRGPARAARALPFPDAVDRRRPRPPGRRRPGVHVRAGRPLPAAGPRHGPAASRPGDGPHIAHRIRVSLAVLPRSCARSGPQRTLVIGLVVLAAGHLWLAHAPQDAGYLVAVLPGLLLVATGVALSFMPTTMVIASRGPGRPGRARVRAGGLGDPDRRGARHRHVHRHRHLAGGRMPACSAPPGSPQRSLPRRWSRWPPQSSGARSHGRGTEFDARAHALAPIWKE